MLFTALLAIAAARRRAPGVIPFAVMMAGLSLWCAASAMEMGSTNLAGKLLWTQVGYAGVVVVPISWFAFAVR
jgi:hypothetical protein